MSNDQMYVLGSSITTVVVAVVVVAIAWRARDQAKAKAKPIRDGGCHGGQDHDWLNWSAPEIATRKVAAGLMTSEVVDQEIYVQTRACTRCNLQQRAVS